MTKKKKKKTGIQRGLFAGSLPSSSPFPSLHWSLIPPWTPSSLSLPSGVSLTPGRRPTPSPFIKVLLLPGSAQMLLPREDLGGALHGLPSPSSAWPGPSSCEVSVYLLSAQQRCSLGPTSSESCPALCHAHSRCSFRVSCIQFVEPPELSACQEGVHL